MATRKITIMLDEAQVDAIGALVHVGQTANMSAFVKHAAKIALSDATKWTEMLDDALLQTGGPLMKDERRWADAILSPRPHRRTTIGG
jgi:Arc/MetJ-type ribon-helix-helix transcriptional regulator